MFLKEIELQTACCVGVGLLCLAGIAIYAWNNYVDMEKKIGVLRKQKAQIESTNNFITNVLAYMNRDNDDRRN